MPAAAFGELLPLISGVPLGCALPGCSPHELRGLLVAGSSKGAEFMLQATSIQTFPEHVAKDVPSHGNQGPFFMLPCFLTFLIRESLLP